MSLSNQGMSDGCCAPLGSIPYGQFLNCVDCIGLKGRQKKFSLGGKTIIPVEPLYDGTSI